MTKSRQRRDKVIEPFHFFPSSHIAAFILSPADPSAYGCKTVPCHRPLYRCHPDRRLHRQSRLPWRMPGAARPISTACPPSPATRQAVSTGTLPRPSGRQPARRAARRRLTAGAPGAGASTVSALLLRWHPENNRRRITGIRPLKNIYGILVVLFVQLSKYACGWSQTGHFAGADLPSMT